MRDSKVSSFHSRPDRRATADNSASTCSSSIDHSSIDVHFISYPTKHLFQLHSRLADDRDRTCKRPSQAESL
jgi:hypothetical protein